MTTAPSSPPRRADAERNRARILGAARAVLADPAAEASMAEIARRADVGMATLYRNFAGRRELLEALFTDEVDAVCAAAGDAGGAPGPALVAWLRRFGEFVRAKHPIARELLQDGGGSLLDGSRARVLAAARPLLEAAQRAGAVRADLNLGQVLDLVIAVCGIPGDPGYVDPILTAALEGLAPSQADDEVDHARQHADPEHVGEQGVAEHDAAQLAGRD